MLFARKSDCENDDSPHSTAGSRAVSRALYSDRKSPDMTLDDGIRPFLSVLRLQAPKSDSKITKNTQNTPWPFLAPPDHANAQLTNIFPVYQRHVLDVILRMPQLSRSCLAAASPLPRNLDAQRKISRSILVRWQVRQLHASPHS
jgi:hypothetical protein